MTSWNMTMETENIILEMYGETKSISRDVQYIREKYDRLDAAVLSLHARVDCQDDKIHKGMGIMAGIGLCIGFMASWFKEKLGY